MRHILVQVVEVLRNHDARLRRVEQGETEMSSDLTRLAQDVSDLTTEEQAAEGRVAAEVANLTAEIDALKANNPALDPAELAGIEAVTSRLKALAVPAPEPSPAPAPTDGTPAADQGTAAPSTQG